MKKAIIIACVCIVLCAAVAVGIAVLRNPDPSANDPAGEEFSSAAAEENDPVDRFPLYKAFYYSQYQSSDAVCLLDLTHDGEDEMLVLRVPEWGENFGEQDNDLRVYTVRSGAVELIYEQTINYNRVEWYITETSGESNLVFVNHNIWQGEGAYLCDEFYLTEQGEPISVNKVEKVVHLGDPDNDWIFEEFESQLADLYGPSFENITLLVSSITEEKNTDLTAEKAFGSAQDTSDPVDQSEPVVRYENSLEPQKEDYDVLGSIVGLLCEYRVSYDCETDSFLDVFYSESHFGTSAGMKAYGLLQDGSTYKSVDSPEQENIIDPLGLFGNAGYYAIREDVLTYYKENVYSNYLPMETEPCYDDESGDCLYYYRNGWYYFRKQLGGSETSVEFTTHKQTEHGSYLIGVDTIEYGVDRTKDAVQLDAILVKKDGKRLWSIYRIIPG